MRILKDDVKTKINTTKLGTIEKTVKKTITGNDPISKTFENH